MGIMAPTWQHLLILTCSCVSLSMAETTLEKLPLPRTFKSVYRVPTLQERACFDMSNPARTIERDFKGVCMPPTDHC